MKFKCKIRQISGCNLHILIRLFHVQHGDLFQENQYGTATAVHELGVQRMALHAAMCEVSSKGLWDRSGPAFQPSLLVHHALPYHPRPCPATIKPQEHTLSRNLSGLPQDSSLLPMLLYAILRRWPRNKSAPSSFLHDRSQLLLGFRLPELVVKRPP